MSVFEKAKELFSKKVVLIGGTILLVVGSGIAYVVANNGKVSFEEWLEMAPTEELKDAYEKLRVEVYLKTGEKPLEMKRIGEVLGHRGAVEWFEKHPPNTDPNFRWTDANRWDKD